MHDRAYYEKEFDSLVDSYKKWLTSPEDIAANKQRKRRAFLQGMASVLDIFGSSRIESSDYLFLPLDPFYSRNDMTAEQKDVVRSGSVWKDMCTNLEMIISKKTSDPEFSIEDAVRSRSLVQRRYDDFKDIYVGIAMNASASDRIPELRVHRQYVN